MNLLKTANGRAIEELADGEELFVDRMGRNVEVLLHAGQVGETNVEELDIVIFDEFENCRRVFKHSLHS